MPLTMEALREACSPSQTRAFCADFVKQARSLPARFSPPQRHPDS